MANETKSGIASAMMMQGTVFGTAPYLKIMNDMKETTYRQRLFNGEMALAFGLERPAIPGEFGPLDVCMTGIVNMATFHHKVEMREVARLVRQHWEALTKALAIAERDLFEEPGVLRNPAVPRSDQQFFALSSTADKKNPLAGIGTMQAAIDQVDGLDRAIFMLDLQRIVRMAYEMAGKAKVKFPERLCPDPADAKAWDSWIEAVEDYRVAAGIRAKARAKRRKVTA